MVSNSLISIKPENRFVEALDDECEITYATSVHGASSWQVKTLQFLLSPTVELTLLGLLVLDIFVLFAGIFLRSRTSGLPICHARDAVCEDGSQAAYHEHHEPVILDAISLIILFVFLLENMLLLVILGAKKFFSNIMYVVDFFVVITSLGLEIAFIIMKEHNLAALAGLLVIARLWWFVRLGHG